VDQWPERRASGARAYRMGKAPLDHYLSMVGGALVRRTQGGVAMPIYEYRCKGCGEEFSRMVSISEQGSSPPRCPKCASDEVRQLFRSISVHTSRKS
jgi:putative FmdB family regulatory protein